MNLKALVKALLQRRFVSSLLLLQFSLTLGLLVNSGMLTIDIHKKLSRNTGMDVDNIFVLTVAVASEAFENESYYRGVLLEDLERLKALPGVITASSQLQLPIQVGGWSYDLNDINHSGMADRHLRSVAHYMGTPKSIESYGLKLLEGRSLTWQDEVNSTKADEKNIVVSKALAEYLYPNQSAVGKLTNRGYVVGVVDNFLHRPIHKDEHQFFHFMVEPILSSRTAQKYVIQVAAGEMPSVRQQAAKTLLKVNADRVILDEFTMRERHTHYFAADTGLRNLFVLLCGMMLLITGISSYAHAQFHATKQRKLMGIRRALGAKRKDVLLYVLCENWLLVVMGALLGVAFVIGINVLLSEQLDISKPRIDLYLLAVGVILASGTLATWLPARKASRIPPVIATRTL